MEYKKGEHKKVARARKKVKKTSNKLKNAERFTPSIKMGLTYDLAQQRIEDNLTNDKPINRSKSYGRILLENVFNFCNTVTLILVIILIAIGQPNQAVSSCIIFINMAIGIYQEIKAKHTVEKLSLVVDSSCTVLRDGVKNTISTRELLLDDLYYLTSGMQVPVDCIIVKGSVEIDESILTGESENVLKSIDRRVLAGSHVVSGKALAQVDKVGKDCYIENVARVARRVTKPRSFIFNVLDRIIKWITFALVPLAVLLFISTKVVAQASFNDTVVQVGGAVLGMLPIGMFLLTSTSLASSVLKLSKKNTLAQDLYSIEMLAMVDTLLLDKTGTITDGKLEVVADYAMTEEEIDLNSILTTLLHATHDDSTTTTALKEKYEKGVRLPVVKSLGFTSGRKYSGVELENEVVYCLGAPDFVLENIDLVNEYMQDHCSQCRYLLLARFNGKLEDFKKEKAIPIYLFSLEDKLRDDVKETLEWFHDNDVDIKIVSGDNPYTVSQIASKTGVYGAENYVNCNGLSDNELADRLEDNSIFGRVSPEQKRTIVKSLQSQGKVVGMIGDGVNDVLALREADCSISFASANEVARNISRIIMMDSNFKTLPSAVLEGRRVIGNVEKVAALYVMKNLFVMFMTLTYAIMTFFTKVDNYPFIPTRLLILEFFVIGIPTLALALQKNNKKVDKNFFINIIKSSVPGAISLIAGVGMILILMSTGVISLANVLDVKSYNSSMAAIALTMSGFATLFIIALPLNRFRLIVIFSMLVLSIISLIGDQILLDSWFFTIDKIKEPIHIIWITVSALVSALTNVIIRLIISKFKKSDELA